MGNDPKRFALAITLSLLVMFAWAYFTKGPPHTQPAEGPKPAAEAAAPEKAAPPPVVVAGVPAATAPAPDAPEETVVLSGEGFQATFSTWGGALKTLTLEGKKYRRDQGSASVPVDLVRITEGQPYPLSLAVLPEGARPEDAATSARAPMTISSKDDRSVTFTGAAGGAQVKKTFRLTGKPFELALTVEVAGGSGGTVGLLFPSYTPPTGSSGGFLFFSGPPLDLSQPICRSGDKTDRYDVKEGKEPERGPGEVLWAGVDHHYFIAAAFPAEPAGSCVMTSGSQKGVGMASLALPLERARKAEFTVYAGPKELDTLRAYGRGFDTAMNYGTAKYFAVFARGLLFIMRWLHDHVVSSWGIAIILLTLLVKAVLFPLTYKQMQSMNEMRKLQPEIEKLKAKHEGDREKLNVAVMQLYQQHKVNPLGGCLPMLLQMPIWFALYAALQTSVELYREPFLWIHDLTIKDPWYVLPIAMGLSSFVMQKLSPQPTENSQAKMMLYFFPIFFTVIMLQVPAGLTLYIFVNNVLSIAQQQIMMKKSQAVQVAPAK